VSAKQHYSGCYLIGNYPDKDTFQKAALKALEHFDFLEVGIPFSDPLADGPVIAGAAHKAIEKGVKYADIMASIAELRQKTAKDIYIMVYANHVFSRGIGVFADDCVKAGVKGLILPDVPYIERERFAEELDRRKLALVSFITPESSEEDIKQRCANAGGFVYAVSMRGTTGQALKVEDDTARKISMARDLCQVPVVTGFGISTADQARAALEFSDGYIIGTRAVQALEGGLDSFERFIDELRGIFT